MSKHLPPIPPENQSSKGPGEHKAMDRETAKGDTRQRNLAEEGRQGNIKQNTTHQGYQQDR